MKKIAIIAALLMVFSVGSVFALGIGVQGGYSVGGNGGAAVTFKLDSPWIFAADIGFPAGGVNVGLTMDNWIGNPVLAKPFRFFYGWGLAGSLGIFDAGLNLFVGARAVAGLNCFVLDNALEFYVQGAWQPGVRFNFYEGVDPIDVVLLSFPITGGFRFWF